MILSGYAAAALKPATRPACIARSRQQSGGDASGMVNIDCTGAGMS
jgi:hypothetical protein